MRNLVKVLCIILAFGMLFTACGKEEAAVSTETVAAESSTAESNTTTEDANKIDISQEVKLKMLLIGDVAKDWDAIMAEFNKMSKKDLNAELETIYVSWADSGTKYPLMMMSGEDLDLCFVANWMDYSKNVQKGAFIPLDDYLQKYAPNALKKLPKEAWDDVLFEGKTYAVPRYKFEYQNWAGVAVRGDLMKKYGITSIESTEDFGKYLDAVKTNENGLIPLNAAAEDWNPGLFMMYGVGLNYADLSVGGSLKYNTLEEKPTVSYDPTDATAMEWHKIASEWYKKGYWSKNILNNKVKSMEAFNAGQSGAACLGLNEFNNTYQTWNTTHPEWDVQFFPFNPKGNPYYTQSFNSTGLAVSVASKNPERSVMLIDKFFESEDYWNMLSYGIKGTHWEPTDDGKIQLPAGKPADGYSQFQNCPWGYGDFQGFHKASKSEWPKMAEYEKMMFENAKPTPLRGFMANTESIKNELAALETVRATYSHSLAWGVGDTVALQKKAADEANKAGLEKVLTELQKQVDEFMASKK